MSNTPKSIQEIRAELLKEQQRALAGNGLRSSVTFSQ